ncbi:hypothetical protein ABRP17_011935 [Stenotrophomonas sp. WHRI 8082]|uniref:hypothetical protein n=1 Tax=Stenotrophomonas sp. WHRI 8082 TaxID=3162571 RepID=UPI0032ED5515
MNKNIPGTLLLACVSTFSAVGSAEAAETSLLYGTASGRLIHFFDVASRAKLQAWAECDSLSGTRTDWLTFDKVVRDGENVITTISQVCVI